MSHLLNKELVGVLEAIAVLNDGVGMNTLAERTLNCIQSLIPNSTMTAFDGLDPEGDYNGSLWYTPPATVPKERVELLAELLHEHPYCQDFFTTADERIFRLSDKLALSKFHKTTLFNEFYRLFDGESQIAAVFRLTPRSLVTCSLHRPKTDFTDSEVQRLRLITPHLKAAFRNAREYELVDNQRKYLSAAVTRGIIVLSADGEIGFINDIAQNHLTIWFDKGCPDRLPEVLVRHVREQGEKFRSEEYNRPPSPLVIRSGGAELIINLAFDTRTNELTLLLEERNERSKDDFQQLGLSARESEILYWMSKGKTDPEIALLCDISYRTVEKHAANLYTKLGVETRLAAVMAAVDRLAN